MGMLTLSTTGCGKNLSNYVSTIIGAMEELKPLLPNLSASLSKAISIAKSFDEAYRAGKFDSATTLFENLVGVINQIIADAGINASDSVKIALSVASVGMRAIAVLLRDQATQPAVASAVKEKAKASAASAKRVSLIESLANSKEVNAVFEAARP